MVSNHDIASVGREVLAPDNFDAGYAFIHRTGGVTKNLKELISLRGRLKCGVVLFSPVDRSY